MFMFMLMNDDKRYTLGGIFLAHYNNSPAGMFDEVGKQTKNKVNLNCFL